MIGWGKVIAATPILSTGEQPLCNAGFRKGGELGRERGGKERVVASSAVSSNMMNKTVIFCGGVEGIGSQRERDIQKVRKTRRDGRGNMII